MKSHYFKVSAIFANLFFAAIISGMGIAEAQSAQEGLLACYATKAPDNQTVKTYARRNAMEYIVKNPKLHNELKTTHFFYKTMNWVMAFDAYKILKDSSIIFFDRDIKPCLSGCYPHPLNVGWVHSPE